MTEINVTVGPATLLQQSRRQVEANRWSRAEQDAQRRTEATARAANQQQLAQQNVTAQGAQRYGTQTKPRFQPQKPAAFRFDQYNLVVLQLFWQNGADYDLNVGANGDYVGWTFSVRDALNDGSLWNQVYWLGDNTNDGPASEYVVIDLTRTPTITSSYPVGQFRVGMFSYCYERLSSLPLTLTAYPSRIRPEDGFITNGGLLEVYRLIELGNSRKVSFSTRINRYNPDGELGIEIGRLDMPSARLAQLHHDP